MNIFIKIKNSVYGPDYYSEVIRKPFSYSLKYYLVFALLFAVVFAIVTTIKFVPTINLFSEKAIQIADYFPQELTINIKDGKASTNVLEPYFIKIPEEYKNIKYKNGKETIVNIAKIDNYAVIDTKNKFDLDKFYSYKTFMLLTKDNIVYMDNGKVSISSLSGVNFTLDRGRVSGIINAAKPFLGLLYPIVFIGVYAAGYTVVLMKMIYLLFGALLIWLVAKIKGMEIGYKKSYQAGIHLMTSVIIIVSILNVFSHKLTFTFLFSILLILSATINLKKREEQSVELSSIVKIDQNP